MAKKQTPEWVKVKADKAQQLSDEKRGRVRVTRPRVRVKLKPEIDPDASTAPPRSHGGKIPKYHPFMIAHAERAMKNGGTIGELAESLGVNPSTIWRWAGYHPKFKRALNVVTDPTTNARMRETIKQCAFGYERNGVYYPPSAAAYKLWVRNKMPEEFPDNTRHTGANDGPIQQQIVELDTEALASMSAEEIAALRKALGKAFGTTPQQAQEVDLRTKAVKHAQDKQEAAYYAKTLH